MRIFLADENARWFKRISGKLLAKVGLSLISVGDSGAPDFKSSDEEIYAWAKINNLPIVTSNIKDFIKLQKSDHTKSFPIIAVSNFFPAANDLPSLLSKISNSISHSEAHGGRLYDARTEDAIKRNPIKGALVAKSSYNRCENCRRLYNIDSHGATDRLGPSCAKR